ncbi:TetR/AcrR family transcriptional regulator [Phycicoccus avicenniae]|uniref:TetR/AcrR family transcriptional regulator n=1 Tax=Phycicoccus avicenniae TaxID=2828860 RepID=UPI003D2E638F
MPPFSLPRPDARPPAPTGRRAELLAAAVEVVADAGLRGLTHRAVDRRAGLPEGTCSAYLRTRGALLVALAEHVGGALEDRVSALSEELADCMGDPDAVAAAVTELTLGWVREPSLVRAQAELSLEAARQPELMEVFERWRRGLLATVEGLGERAGAPEPSDDAVVLVAAVEGLLVTAVRLPGAEREPLLRGAVPRLVHSLHEAR